MPQTEAQAQAALEAAEAAWLKEPGPARRRRTECDSAEDCAASGRRSCRGCRHEYQTEEDE